MKPAKVNFPGGGNRRNHNANTNGTSSPRGHPRSNNSSQPGFRLS